MKVEQLEKSINLFLQQNIKISINNKFIKTGRLILFAIKDFYLVFTLSIQQSKKIVEVPYPFDFFIKDGKVFLNYSINKFSSNITEAENHIKLLAPKKPNKFFNSCAEISVVED